MQFGMPTLIENPTLADNIALCRSLGLRFIELNMNFPEYQLDRLEQTDELLRAAAAQRTPSATTPGSANFCGGSRQTGASR